MLLYDGSHVQHDLEAIRRWSAPANDADLIDAFLTQVSESEEAMWTLREWRGEFQPPLFNCCAIDSFHRRGFNVYRMRPLRGRLSRYRIIYALDVAHDEICVLAVTLKRLPNLPAHETTEFHYGYEPEHPVTQRCEGEYEQRSFRKLR
jgi:hypothetical protein